LNAVPASNVTRVYSLAGQTRAALTFDRVGNAANTCDGTKGNIAAVASNERRDTDTPWTEIKRAVSQAVVDRVAW
jgi:hypothetical protein